MKLLTACLLSIVFLVIPVFAEECQVKGLKIQWLTDYCMYKLETDDILEIDACMNDDAKNNYKDDCFAKIKYKRKMCKIAIEEEWIKNTVQGCLTDQSFMGSTVKHSGKTNKK